jgi:hypothetical protein
MAGLLLMTDGVMHLLAAVGRIRADATMIPIVRARERHIRGWTLTNRL